MNTSLGLSTHLEDLTLESLPSERIEVYAYGYLYYIETDIKILIVFKGEKDKKPIFFTRLINVNLLYAFPLSRISVNKMLIDEFSSQEITGCKLSLASAVRLKGYQIKSLNEYMEILPRQGEANNNLNYAFKEQWFVKFRDLTTQATFYLPEYEIMRYFYLTSASMTRTLFRSPLNTLYTSYVYDPSPDRKCEISLNNNANNDDAQNIFRFIVSPKANQQWHNTSRVIRSHGVKLKEALEAKNWKSTYHKTYIGAFIPSDNDVITMKVGAHKLSDGSYLICHIMEEDTPYPFKSLVVSREQHTSNGSKAPENGNKNEKHTSPENKPPNKTSENKPSSQNESIDVSIQQKNFKTIKRGLDDTTVTYITKIIVATPQGQTFNTTNENINAISTNESGLDGDKEVAHGITKIYFQSESEKLTPPQEEPKSNPDDEKEDQTPKEKSYKLENFRRMVTYLATQDENIQYSLLDEKYMPNTTVKKKRKRSESATKLANGSNRRYTGAWITHNDRKFFLLEIEHDTNIPAISTVMLTGKEVTQDDITRIVQEYVNLGAAWGDWSKMGLNAKYIRHIECKDDSDVERWGMGIIEDNSKIMVQFS